MTSRGIRPAGQVAAILTEDQYFALSQISVQNAKLSAELNLAGDLIVKVKTFADIDPSVDDSIYVAFPTFVNNGLVVLTVGNGAPLPSLTLPLGATFGTVANISFRVWFVLVSAGGVVSLGAINCSSASQIYPLERSLATTVISTSADSAGVCYVGADDGAGTFPIRVLGYMDWNSGLATPGTWNVLPDLIMPWVQGMPLPCTVLQRVDNVSGAVATGTNQFPNDDTIPQIGEGDQYFSTLIQPKSPCNMIENFASLNCANSVAVESAAAIFRVGTSDALTSRLGSANAAGKAIAIDLHCIERAKDTSITYTVRASGIGAAGTMTLNGAAAARRFGGALNSSHTVSEIMG